jgi:hypothetical protein
MLERDNVLKFVTRIYEDAEEVDGDCIDMAHGDLIMSFSPGSDVGEAVFMRPCVVEQFERMGWGPKGPLIVPELHCCEVSEETDARLRAMVALLDEQPLIRESLDG